MQEEIDFYSTSQKVLGNIAPLSGSDIYQVKRPNQEQTLSTIKDIISQKKELLNGYYNKLKNGYDIDASLNELIMKNDISIEDLKVLKSNLLILSHFQFFIN